MSVEVGKRLFTRDGRKVGNGIVVGRAEPGLRDQNDLWKIETDFGNTMTLTESELVELYHLEWEPEPDPHDHSIEEWRNSREQNVLSGRDFRWINEPVRVTGEDFTYEAICLCSFPKNSGKVRYVVEDHGRIFIQRREQLTFFGGRS